MVARSAAHSGATGRRHAGVGIGQLSVYAARGDMQFVVTAMEAAGDGLWRKALELSLKRLQADGLPAPERKRRVPPFPRRIAVITSPDGAALHDVMAVVRRRWPLVELVVVPAKVQGEGARRSCSRRSGA